MTSKEENSFDIFHNGRFIPPARRQQENRTNSFQSLFDWRYSNISPEISLKHPFDTNDVWLKPLKWLRNVTFSFYYNMDFLLFNGRLLHCELEMNRTILTSLLAHLHQFFLIL